MQFKSILIGGGTLFLLIAAFSSCIPQQQRNPSDREPVARVEEPEDTVSKDVAPEGWVPTGTTGIYMRWCQSGECSKEGVTGDNHFVILKIWCKERPCGDIYGRVNLIDENNVVVGWTNDTAYGDAGQEVLLTFDTHLDLDTARLTELSFR